MNLNKLSYKSDVSILRYISISDFVLQNAWTVSSEFISDPLGPFHTSHTKLQDPNASHTDA